jgi:hypothetical protein
MRRRDIPDRLLCETVRDAETWRMTVPALDEVLMEKTGERRKVCMQAIESAVRRGLLDYGYNITRAWLAPRGLALLRRTDRQTERTAPHE